MRDVAHAENAHASVTYAGGDAAALPLSSGTCDLVWMSQVLHHLPDLRATAREIHRVLRPDGRVFIRGTFGDRLEGYPDLFQFFPGARRVATDFPSLSRVVATFQAAGFRSEALETISQIACQSLVELATRARLRADTTLALLSDEEFTRGLTMLERASRQEGPQRPIVESVDLLVLSR